MRVTAPGWQAALAFLLSLLFLCSMIGWLQNVHIITSNGMFKSIQAEPWIADPEIGKFAIATTGCQRRPNEVSELGFARVDEPARFIDLEVANPGGVRLFERGNTTPSVIRSDLALAPSHV